MKSFVIFGYLAYQMAGKSLYSDLIEENVPVAEMSKFWKNSLGLSKNTFSKQIKPSIS
jgi:hypothetical protein